MQWDGRNSGVKSEGKVQQSYPRVTRVSTMDPYERHKQQTKKNYCTTFRRRAENFIRLILSDFVSAQLKM